MFFVVSVVSSAVGFAFGAMFAVFLIDKED